MLLIGYEDGVKCAIVSIDQMEDEELQTILEIWKECGRTHEYQLENKKVVGSLTRQENSFHLHSPNKS